MRTCYSVSCAAIGLLTLLAACGANTPSPQAPVQESSTAQSASGGEFQMQSELGVVEVSDVDGVFRSIQGKMARCFDRGHPLASGVTVFRMRIGPKGQLKWAYLAESSIGDRTIEKCTLDVLSAAAWPIPMGGGDALAEKPFEFPDREERGPVLWPAKRVASQLGSLRPKLEACREHSASAARFVATAIVDTDGSVAAAGAAPSDERAEGAVDCVVEAVKAMKLSSPGSWPAKVTFEVP